MQIQNTLFIGKELHYLKEVDSTNSYLKEIIAKTSKQQEGFLVVAEHQTKGRGQTGNVWISEPGKNIMMSVLFYPQFLEARQIFYLNKAITLAVRECVAFILTKTNDSQSASVKWPNDILVGERKVAGILIENSLRNNRIEYSVAGIGMNINQKFKEISEFNAISLNEIFKTEVDIYEMINLLCGMLEKYYLLLKGFDFKKIEDLYNAHLFGIEVERKFVEAGKKISGVIRGVNAMGQLMIETGGKIKEYNLKEIIYVWGN